MANTSYQQEKNLSRFKNRGKIGILGAGVSGLSAAIILAKKGCQVNVFERRSRVGSFFKKDVHSLRNYSYGYDVIKKYNELGLKLPRVYPISKEFRFSPSLKSIEIYSNNKPLFYNILRGYSDKESLDNSLLRQAEELGVKVHYNQNIDPSDSKIDIVATGAFSKKGTVYGSHLKGIDVEENSLYIFLTNYNSHYGYVYLVPFYGKEASLAIVSPQGEDISILKNRLEDLKENNSFIRKAICNAGLVNSFSGFASFDVPETATKDGKLYIGEAAGFLDSTTGFGLHYAILSGSLAAKSIIEGGNYDDLWRKNFLDNLRKRYQRRLAFEKTTALNQEKMISGLIDNFGGRVLVSDYKKIYDKYSHKVNV